MIEELQKLQNEAGLTVSEMARWYGVGYSTYYGWVRRGISPAPFKVAQLMAQSAGLVKSIAAGLLPIPLSVKQGKRAFYLKELKDGYNSGVPSARLTRDRILPRMEQE